MAGESVGDGHFDETEEMVELPAEDVSYGVDDYDESWAQDDTPDYTVDPIAATIEQAGSIEAAGLGIITSNETGVQLEIRNPDAFAEMLDDIEVGSPLGEYLRNEGAPVVSKALHRVSSSVYFSHNEEVTGPWRTADAKLPPEDVDPRYFSADAAVTQARMTFVNAMASRADTLADHLRRLEAPEATVAALEELGLAGQDDMLHEWTGLYVARAIGHSDTRAGIDRLGRTVDWARLLPGLRALRDRDAQAAFTQRVRQTLLTDINTSIAQLTDGIRDGLNPAAFSVDEWDQVWSENPAWGQAFQQYDDHIPGLRYAQTQIARILPKPQE